jgi:hypothetical protein
MHKIIGIIGTRRRNTRKDFDTVLEAFSSVYEEGDWICSGGCPKGGDRFARMIHKQNDIPYLEFPANWTKYGKSAGFRRNTDIAQHSDILIACVAEDRTGGTEDTIKKFRAKDTILDRGKVIWSIR